MTVCYCMVYIIVSISSIWIVFVSLQCLKRESTCLKIEQISQHFMLVFFHPDKRKKVVMDGNDMSVNNAIIFIFG